jgi:phage N-6-adenine-methyltransferase
MGTKKTAKKAAAKSGNKKAATKVEGGERKVVLKLNASSAYGKLVPDPAAQKTAQAEGEKESQSMEEAGPGGPRITKGNSDGLYGTPRDFLAACEKKFGKIVFDLAATKGNKRVEEFYSIEEDSLKQDWVTLGSKRKGILWLNPPYTDIKPWVSKCREFGEAAKASDKMKGGILLLVPASVGAKWFRDHAYKKADTYFLYGRLKFEGHPTVYPKDCMVIHFHGEAKGKMEIWDWREEIADEEGAKKTAA